MPDQANTQELAESYLRELVEKNSDDWESRKKLAQILYNEGKTKEAAAIVWDAPEIPSIDLELGFAVKVLGKGAPSKAIRLLSSIQELNKGKAVQNLAVANALMHYGMVMQAARFYGAAFADDPSLVNADLEHFLLWVDDKEKIWGNFEKDKPNLAELPWMKRDAKEAESLKMAMQGHTTPIKIPNLAEVTAEAVVNTMYSQATQLNVQSTPPPAVTIPMDRVNPKDVIVDSQLGANEPASAQPTGGGTGQALPPAPAPLAAKPLAPPKPLAAPKPLAEPKPLSPSNTPAKEQNPSPAVQPAVIPAAAPTLLTPATNEPPEAPTPPSLIPAQATGATPPNPASQVKPAVPLTANTIAIPEKAVSATQPTIQMPQEPKQPEAPSLAQASSPAAAPPAVTPSAPISGNPSDPVPILAAKPSNPDSNGEVQPMKLKAPGLTSTDAPLLRPVSTSTLVDGKIVINRPSNDSEAAK